MTVEECYEAIRGDYTEVAARYKSDEKIKKVMLKALNDSCYSELCVAVERRDTQTALAAANDLKVICTNLSFKNLGYSVTAFTENLRGKQEFDAETESLFKQVKKDYALTSACVRLVADE